MTLISYTYFLAFALMIFVDTVSIITVIIIYFIMTMLSWPGPSRLILNSMITDKPPNDELNIYFSFHIDLMLYKFFPWFQHIYS